jgi:hypothetical protein
MHEPSLQDRQYLKKLRANVETFMKQAASSAQDGQTWLDIAPQDHNGVKPYLPVTVKLETLDINPKSGCDYICDLCGQIDQNLKDRYDAIICTEVLDHVNNPFQAASNMLSMLKPGGRVYASTPFNFRIHGPLPDCWRFTEHGLRQLFSGYEIVKIIELPTPGRALMPIGYTLEARKS